MVRDRRYALLHLFTVLARKIKFGGQGGLYLSICLYVLHLSCRAVRYDEKNVKKRFLCQGCKRVNCSIDRQL